MPKIAFMGAGSTVFARNIIGDTLLAEAMADSHFALYDIDAGRLEESRRMAENLNHSLNDGHATVSAHLGSEHRRDALEGADFVIVAIQVGGYDPATIRDFDIPKKYGLRQTIGDTLGIGGIVRALRTIPVVLDFALEMEELCPRALMLNYTNPMAMVTGAVQQASSISTVGLCHSVQACVPGLLQRVGLSELTDEVRWRIAGINHMAWLTEIEHRGVDLYPEIKRRAAKMNEEARKSGAGKHDDMVRFEIMKQFGYYVTESSEHNAEYTPFWIKAAYPGLIEEFNVPLDEYPRRCVQQIESWKERGREITENRDVEHSRTHEYGSYIMEAMVTGEPIRIHGNVPNGGLIENLPARACVEVPCLVDRNGVQGVRVGSLPEQCAALNRTNINVQLLAIDAALTGNRETAYQAAFLDPHTAAELSIDDIRSLVDELIDAHVEYLRL